MQKYLWLISMAFLFTYCSEEEPTFDCSASDLSLEILSVEESFCGSSSGTIEVTATGGSAPYSFSINGTNANDIGLFTSVPQGDYLVIVTDANNCSVGKEVTVNSTGEISFSQVVAPILENNCTIPSCHVPEEGSSRQDLTNFTLVQQFASEIKRRTQNGEMPRGSTLSQRDIDLIACWVDNGAQDN
jgi:hypothetical protein